jgi:hypothetical protein
MGETLSQEVQDLAAETVPPPIPADVPGADLGKGGEQ